MRLTRKIISEFVGVFLIGALAGGLLTYCYTDRQLSSFMTRMSEPETQIAARISKKYVDQYHLTPEEQKRIEPLIDEMAQSLYKVRHQFGVDILSTLDNYHEEIATQLNPDHRDAYVKAMEERKKTLRALLLPDQGSPTQGQK